MTQNQEERLPKVAPVRPPGYLMAPFGWTAAPLAAWLQRDPSLYPAVFTLSRQRMHLIALALAHCTGEADVSVARLIVTGALGAVLDAVLRHRLNGLKRALDHLPVAVLPRSSYQHLVELLDQRSTAKLIYRANTLSEGYLDTLHSVPAPLRRIVSSIADGNLLKRKRLGDGLRLLAARGAAPSFDALIADLAAIRQPAQFLARIAKLVEQLPLPEGMPPAKVGEARRLDEVAEIRELSKRWKNCLVDCYLDSVNDGRVAVYHWPHAEAPAVCLVSRHRRLGWALQDAKGPENADLPPARSEEIGRAFASADIPCDSVVEALEDAVDTRWLRRHGIHPPPRDEAAELEEVYEEALEAARV